MINRRFYIVYYLLFYCTMYGYAQNDCQSYLKKVEQAKDAVEKVKYVQLAADCGNEQCQFEIGYFFYESSEKFRDKIQGMSDADSNEVYKEVYKEVIVQKGKAAIEYLAMAAETGHPTAQALLCLIYYEGHIVKKDLDAAKSWAKKVRSNNRSTEVDKEIVNDVEGAIEELEKKIDWFLGL